MHDNSLRGFLDELDKIGELVRVKEEVQPEEIFSIQWKLFDDKGPAVILENVKGHTMPIVINIFGTQDRWAMACGFPQGKSMKDYRNMYLEKMDNKGAWLKPKLVNSGPCKEVILHGDEARFSKLPVFKWHPRDGGPYITLPASITRDDRFGTNVGTYRMMLQDDKTSTIMCNIFQHQGIYLNRARRKGKDSIDCAIALGAHPSIHVTSVSTLDIRDNELELAGALQGRPVEVVKAETSDLEVPANAEIILEGEISTHERKEEAPFAEYPGYHEEPLVLPVFTLKCITMRKDAMYQMTTADKAGEIVRGIPQEATLVQQMRERVTGFVDCWLPRSGRGFMAIVSIRKYFPGWGQHAIYQVLSLVYTGAAINCVVIVDDDIDPSDLEQVIWAISTRVDPFYDVIITKPMAVFGLNPAAQEMLGVNEATGSSDFFKASKMGIDATLKRGVERPVRGEAPLVRLPEEIVREVERKWSQLGLGDTRV